MNRLSVPSILVVFLLGGCAQIVKYPPTGSDDFDERVSRYSEDMLLEPLPVDDNGVPVFVGSGGCKVSDELRDEFDALIPLSASDQSSAEEIHAKFGFPVDTLGGDLDHLLHHDRYVLGYNADLKVPVVASYFLSEDDLVSGVREDCFREDHRLDESDRSRLIDYDFQITQFDRGHMVPDADLQSTQSDAVNSYYMSNMSPQHKTFNRGAWKLLEASVRLWADERDDVHVISGAIFDRDQNDERDREEDAERAPPTRNVAVATAFYKIILDEDASGNLDAIAFMLPHSRESTAPNVPYITNHIVSIDRIEQISGYDFFPELSDSVEEELESLISEDLWCRRRWSATSGTAIV